MTHQQLIDKAYETYGDEASGTRLAWKESLDPLHRAAVQLGSFNAQIENGGWSQWAWNGYANEDLADVAALFERGVAQEIDGARELLELVREFEDLGVPDDYAEEWDEEEDCYECGGLGYADSEDGEEDESCLACAGSGTEVNEAEDDGEEAYGYEIERAKLDERLYALDGRLATYEQILARLDEEVDASEVKVVRKPRCKLIGTDGNVFALMGRAWRVLIDAGQEEQAREMQDRVRVSGAYCEALCVITEYVQVH